MIVTALRKPVRLIGKGLRELVLILGVGVLGSQLLITLNGGQPLGTTAEASSIVTEGSRRVVLSSIQYELNPYSPTELESINVSAAALDGSTLQTLHIALSTDKTTYTCRHEGSGLWHCPTPGFQVVDLESIIATGS